MADSEIPRDEEGNHLARLTFIWTMLLALGFVGAVFIFILR